MVCTSGMARHDHLYRRGLEEEAVIRPGVRAYKMLCDEMGARTASEVDERLAWTVDFLRESSPPPCTRARTRSRSSTRSWRTPLRRSSPSRRRRSRQERRRECGPTDHISPQGLRPRESKRHRLGRQRGHGGAVGSYQGTRPAARRARDRRDGRLSVLRSPRQEVRGQADSPLNPPRARLLRPAHGQDLRSEVLPRLRRRPLRHVLRCLCQSRGFPRKWVRRAPLPENQRWRSLTAGSHFAVMRMTHLIACQGKTEAQTIYQNGKDSPPRPSSPHLGTF